MEEYLLQLRSIMLINTYLSLSTEVTGSIVDEVGTPTLALVPVIIVLVVMLVILVGCIIAMKVRHKEVSSIAIYRTVYTHTL